MEYYIFSSGVLGVDLKSKDVEDKRRLGVGSFRGCSFGRFKYSLTFLAVTSRSKSFDSNRLCNDNIIHDHVPLLLQEGDSMEKLAILKKTVDTSFLKLCLPWSFMVSKQTKDS